MTTPFWCLGAIALMPQAIALAGDYFRKTALGSIDNANPRGQAALLDGAGARAYAAQANSWEALSTFAVFVFIAHLAGADPGLSATAAIIFVVARVLHAVFYISGLSTLRSTSFMVGLGCCIWLLVLAARA